MSAVIVRAAGLVTGWGTGVAALPADAGGAADGRRVIVARPKARAGDRLRRATRECLLAVDAVEALLDDGGLARADIAGARTALVYVTAAAYGASNRAFVVGGGGALHFPYTAPSAVPAEVAIEFGLHGAYTVLIGGATATIDALQHAATLLARGACDRALVLAVETFLECDALYARGRWLLDAPLVEAAAAVLLERTAGEQSATPTMTAERSATPPMTGERSATPAMTEPSATPTTTAEASRPPAMTAEGGLGGASRVPPINSQTLACAPLVALAVAHAGAHETAALHARWRGREATMTLAVSGRRDAAGP